mgnify:CR=1 FL=1
MSDPTFVELGHYQVRKRGQGADGDAFLSRKAEDGRIISALSDGLGSGVKAGVLAMLTASMAVKFVSEDIPIQRAAGIIMKTLPVCSERRISYATFTLVDIDSQDIVKIVEYDNPAYILIREHTQVEPIKGEIKVMRTGRGRASVARGAVGREALMRYSEFKAQPGDRLVFFSDGLTQAGMGTRAHPLGRGAPAVQAFTLGLVNEKPDISARELARRMVQEAEAVDAYAPKDDISCAVVYFRKPRRLLVMTGPSVDPSRDAEMASIFERYEGRKLLCGGTTAGIVARELGRTVSIVLERVARDVPPASIMEGADLVTEGIITLGKAAELLERGEAAVRAERGPAARAAELFLDSDQIEFVVGTKINEAHQDPSMPVELEIRRNIVKRVATTLRERYLKEVELRFI